MLQLRLLVLISSLFLFACAAQYPNQDPTGKVFPNVAGTSLAEEPIKIPDNFVGKQTLLLLGYVQDSQFDIDRWLIALDFTETKVNVYELPTIAGMAPRMFSGFIDDGMRKGIPKELWKGVITIYSGGDEVQEFTGNEKPNNARVLLLDESGKIIYFYDRGFSPSALRTLKSLIKSNETAS